MSHNLEMKYLDHTLQLFLLITLTMLFGFIMTQIMGWLLGWSQKTLKKLDSAVIVVSMVCVIGMVVLLLLNLTLRLVVSKNLVMVTLQLHEHLGL